MLFIICTDAQELYEQFEKVIKHVVNGFGWKCDLSHGVFPKNLPMSYYGDCMLVGGLYVDRVSRVSFLCKIRSLDILLCFGNNFISTFCIKNVFFIYTYQERSNSGRGERQ